MAVLALIAPPSVYKQNKNLSQDSLQSFLFDTAANYTMDPLQPVPHVNLMMDTFIANSNVEEYVPCSSPISHFFEFLHRCC